jgi:hypothetical protein
MRVERYRYPPSVQIALAIETVEIGGAALPFRVAPKRAGSGSGAPKARSAQGEAPHSSATDLVVIELPGDRGILRPGYRTEWVTATP